MVNNEIGTVEYVVGGFSAGYFNTVGSKEGWTPKAFKSTTKERASVNQKVQDFMDEEDLGSFGISPLVLRPRNQFEPESQISLGMGMAKGEQIPGAPVLDQIIQPVKDTVGVKILLKLGWRQGKGIGPLKRKLWRNDDNIALDQQEKKFYGCNLQPGFSKEHQLGSNHVGETEYIQLAPEDIDPVLCNPKDNLFGLGYIGLDKGKLSGNSSASSNQHQFRLSRKDVSNKGEAFGVGAFEDKDEEIYSIEDISQYDFALETPEERKHRRKLERNLKKTENFPVDCVAGFVKASEIAAQGKYFSPPEVPKDFVLIHESKKSRFDSNQTSIKNMETDRSNKLTCKERRLVLGDVEIKVDEPVAQYKHDLVATTSQDSAGVLPAEKAERLHKFVSVLQAFKGNQEASFKPFIKNIEKQERYEKYLVLNAAGFKDYLSDLQPPEMTEFERVTEKLEFERAGSLYKPLSAEISSRFVSAQSHDISNQAMSYEAELNKQTDDPKFAATTNLFGKLTHKTMEWHPDRLLCKRFNVPHPYPDSKFVGTVEKESMHTLVNEQEQASSQSAGSVVVKRNISGRTTSLFDSVDFSKPPPGLLKPEVSVVINPILGSQVTNLSPDKFVDTELLESRRKPPIDLFKEIFACTSESEEESEPESLQIIQKLQEEPASAIFSAVDTLNTNNFNSTHGYDGSSSSDNEVNPYVPQMPSSFQKLVTNQSQIFMGNEPRETNCIWVEKPSSQENQMDYRRNKRTKSSKHKLKHKHKKRREH